MKIDSKLSLGLTLLAASTAFYAIHYSLALRTTPFQSDASPVVNG